MADEVEDEIDVEGFDDRDGSSNLIAKDAVSSIEEYKSQEGVASQIWNEFGVPVCDWSLGEMDAESRLTIESMLHEEQKYLRCKSEPVSKRSKKKSSSYLRWTPQERLQFEKGYMNYGNRWTQIAKMIPTRSPLQVKNYARYYFPSRGKSVSNITSDIKDPDLVDQDIIHSHVPESLSTGSPTITTRIRLPNAHQVSYPSKRRHFQKFGFANLSSSRLLKSRSGKEALSSLKLSKKRTKSKVDKGTPEHGRRLKKRREAQAQRVKSMTDDAAGVMKHCDADPKEKTEDAVGGGDITPVPFKQGGGIVRIRPESSEDEDVDVEDDEAPDSSLMGLAATCDRIYSSLIMPSNTTTQSASSTTSTTTTSTPAHTDVKHPSAQPKTSVHPPEGLKFKDHKVTQEGVVIPGLAWNADHTYSMSAKTLHKLGILTRVNSEPLEPTESTSLSKSIKELTETMDIDSSIKMEMVITDESEHIAVGNSGKRSTPPAAAHPDKEENVEDIKSEPYEDDVSVLEGGMSRFDIKQELDASDLSDTDTRDQVMDITSDMQDIVVPQTPLGQNLDIYSPNTLAGEEVTGPFHNGEFESCLTSEEDQTISGSLLELRSSTSPSSGPDVSLEMQCETVESNHEKEHLEDEEGQEESDAPQGEDTLQGKLDVATRELTLKLDEINDWEKQAIPEFFQGGPTKTQDRYLKIRNYIYEHWLQTKPNYLNKASVRQGLRSCGDVNSIGRIHQILETFGAINFGIDNPYKTTIDTRANTMKRRVISKPDKLTACRESRRRVCKMKNVDSKSDALQKPEEVPSPRKSSRTGHRKPKPVTYDPFKLIECCRFTEDKNAPFHVRIQSDSMIIMDVHSHMSSTEVIGLLGGKFLKEDRILDVLQAVPCNSISTGMQCEMDPVSQTEAYEAIIAKGYQVVGWYHSHPAFAANPSVRDIETQSEFQGWFSQGGAPFIGVIVSPCHNYQISQSKVCCLTISKEWATELKCWKPYQFDFTVSHSHCDNLQTMNTVSNVVTKFAGYQYRSEMLYLWSRHYDISFLEKMLRSIKTYICPDQQEGLLKQIEAFITAEFTNKQEQEEDH